jgi:hypothetical protein
VASLSITNSEIKARLAMQMGINRDDGEWSATNLSDANRIIRAGRRKLFSAYDWSFLEVRHNIAIPAPLTTGTITIVNGVVTLVGSTFPTDVANQYLYAGGGLYQINTRDSATQLTLLDLTVDLAALSTYAVHYTRFALPANFSAVVGPFTIENSQISCALQELPVIPEHQVRGLLSNRTAYTAQPKCFSIFHTVDAETGIPSHFVNIYPFPDVEYLATVRVRILPGDSLAELGDVCGAEYAEILLEAILAACEQLYNDQAGLHTELFQKMLPDFIRKDKVAQGVRRLLPRDSGRGLPHNYQLMIAPMIIQE